MIWFCSLGTVGYGFTIMDTVRNSFAESRERHATSLGTSSGIIDKQENIFGDFLYFFEFNVRYVFFLQKNVFFNELDLADDGAGNVDPVTGKRVLGYHKAVFSFHLYLL